MLNIILFIMLTVTVMFSIIIAANDVSFMWQLLYVWLFDRKVYKAYKSIDYSNLEYYDSWEDWYNSGKYRKGNQLVNFAHDLDLLLYKDGTIVISGFYDKILNKVKSNLEKEKL